MKKRRCLIRIECDCLAAEDGTKTLAQLRRDGWTYVKRSRGHADPSSWQTHSGVCPDCSRRDKLTVDDSEIRFNDDGTIDEIVVRDRRGKVLFHLEQMSDQGFWAVMYERGRKDGVHLWIGSVNGRTHTTARVMDYDRELRLKRKGI